MGIVNVGDRVESRHNGVRVEGEVQSIALQPLRTGYEAMVTVKVDRRAGETVEAETTQSPAHYWYALGTFPEGACASCGQVHDESAMITDKIIDLFNQFKAAKGADRREIIIAIASEFASNIDEADYEAPDWAHDLCIKIRDAFTELEDAQLQLGRSVLSMLESENQQGRLRSALVQLIAHRGSTPPAQGGLN